jgi:hypothetical protein
VRSETPAGVWRLTLEGAQVIAATENPRVYGKVSHSNWSHAWTMRLNFTEQGRILEPWPSESITASKGV